MQGWAKIKGAAKYAGVSDRLMRRWLKEGLRHSRLPSGLILIAFWDIDRFLESFADQGDQVDQIADAVFKDLNISGGGG